MFVEISPEYLRSIASDSDRIPKLYYHPLTIARKFFWLRLKQIHSLMLKHLVHRDSCLDFGCGSGTFLPTLSGLFRSVKGVDLELVEASKIVEHYALNNVRLVLAGGSAVEPDEQVDAIVAADVLEHFENLDEPLSTILRWLKNDGLLFTSLPTENLFTRLTRILGGYAKPADHYRSGEEVEKILIHRGFIQIDHKLVLFWFPLYRLGVWRKAS